MPSTDRDTAGNVYYAPSCTYSPPSVEDYKCAYKELSSRSLSGSLTHSRMRSLGIDCDCSMSSGSHSALKSYHALKQATGVTLHFNNSQLVNLPFAYSAIEEGLKSLDPDRPGAENDNVEAARNKLLAERQSLVASARDRDRAIGNVTDAYKTWRDARKQDRVDCYDCRSNMDSRWLPKSEHGAFNMEESAQTRWDPEPVKILDRCLERLAQYQLTLRMKYGDSHRAPKYREEGHERSRGSYTDSQRPERGSRGGSHPRRRHRSSTEYGSSTYADPPLSRNSGRYDPSDDRGSGRSGTGGCQSESYADFRFMSGETIEEFLDGLSVAYTSLKAGRFLSKKAKWIGGIFDDDDDFKIRRIRYD